MADILEDDDDEEIDEQVRSPVVLDEHDTAAVIALLMRVVRLDDELTEDRKLVEEANARIATNSLMRSRAVSAFSVFGFDITDGLWNRVCAALGNETYDRAIEMGKGTEPPKLLEQMGEAVVAKSAAPDRNVGHRAPKVKDAILDYLRVVGDAGVTARQVREHLSTAYGLEVHEKTPGMTLYRLLKDGLARRQGRTWYAAMRGASDKLGPPNSDEEGGP
jgi:hypothetical protein